MVKALLPMERLYLPALVRSRGRGGVEDLVRAEEVGVAEGDLLIENADVAVGLAVERHGNAG
jgi:hypothetical protein